MVFSIVRIRLNEWRDYWQAIKEDNVILLGDLTKKSVTMRNSSLLSPQKFVQNLQMLPQWAVKAVCIYAYRTFINLATNVARGCRTTVPWIFDDIIYETFVKTQSVARLQCCGEISIRTWSVCVCVCFVRVWLPRIGCMIPLLCNYWQSIIFWNFGLTCKEWTLVSQNSEWKKHERDIQCGNMW